MYASVIVEFNVSDAAAAPFAASCYNSHGHKTCVCAVS